MTGFFEELKRRKVYRVAVAYVVVAGGTIQLASAVFPAWDLPNWALRLIIVLLLVGFPVALILAWAFDVTPQGIRTTPRADTSSPSHRRRNIVALCLAGLVVSGAAGFFLLPRASAGKLEKSIAVLPFQNFSDDKENAFFADGIQDDILTNLAKIGDLKVISRTSVMSYRGTEKSVRDIGKALGVSAILEGSVRKDKNRVRVNVQLINATNDEHIWAEDYDRDLTDVFAIQTDLAQKIAEELKAKLSPSEKAQMTRKPTENGEAYLAFIEAHNLVIALEDFAKLTKAEQLFDRAIQLDPNFALAIAEQSHLQSWMVHSFDPSAQRRQRARDLATRALQLQPNLPEAHLAMGFAYYYGDGDYQAALTEFGKAREGLPNSSEVYLAIAAIERRQGRWKESTANLEKSASLDPNSTWALQNLAINYRMMRDFDAANRTIDRALKLDPKSLTLWAFKAQFALAERGDTGVTDKMLAMIDNDPELKGSPHAALTRANAYDMQRKFVEMARELEGVPDEAVEKSGGKVSGKYLWLGLARTRLGDRDAARAALSKAKQMTEQTLQTVPNDPKSHGELAEILALLGEKERAIAEGIRATELQSEATDAFEGVVQTEVLAHVYAAVGESDKAIDLIEHLLGRPGDLTVALLKLDPAWDGLRDHPRFKKIVGDTSA